MKTQYRRVHVGEVVRAVMPHSEVMMLMRLAGKPHAVLIRPNGAYVDAGTGPHVTLGEAGISQDADGTMHARVVTEPGDR